MRFAASVVSSFAALFVVACGSAGSKGADPLPTAPDPQPPAAPSAASPSDDSSNPAPVPVVCDAQSATFTPAHPKTNVLFVLDRSGSMEMRLTTGGTRWTATRDALFATLGALPPATTRANVMQFPQGDNPLDTCCTIDAQNQVACTCSSYPVPTARCSEATYQPRIPVDLDAASLKEMEDRVHLSDGHFYWGTPLAAAIGSAIAMQRSSTNDGVKAIVVLTDGEPTSCETAADPNANDVAHVIDAVKTGMGGAETIRTFVVGVLDSSNGANATLLSQVAAAGGTGKLFGVDANKLATDLPAALSQIALASTACTFDLPAGGPMLDPSTVNVTITSGGGKASVVARDASHANGWDYVDGGKRFELFGAACTTVQSDASAKIDVVVGCKTQAADGAASP